jgi:putative glutamine amidotransferase
MRPLIGISSYGRAGTRQTFSVPCEYVDVIRKVGGVPLIIPPIEEEVPEALEPLAALVLSGGGDVDPVHYGGIRHEAVYGVSEERDRFELALARAALARRLPILCVCRGMQLLNVALGGDLVAHIPDHYGDVVAHRKQEHMPCTHGVRIEAGSRLAGILGTTDLEVRSWHHQAVGRLGTGLRAVAWSPDGVIEAFESDNHGFLVGVQWHPEMDALGDDRQRALFEALIGSSGNGTRK